MADRFYGWSDRANKYKTWDVMKSLVHSVELPLVFFGDFNEILSMNEKKVALSETRGILRLLEVVLMLVLLLIWVIMVAASLGVEGNLLHLLCVKDRIIFLHPWNGWIYSHALMFVKFRYISQSMPPICFALRIKGGRIAGKNCFVLSPFGCQMRSARRL